ncbi:NmrA family NAD(P)-binding protein [Chryseobacterium gleum]|uniref:NmrA family NAD(P)-binding protein n=1 Tax=Chryseobacterium gleum TaxID=250 RepID=UPI0028A8BBAA|nr:NmrA family NAD(P)-binding protein [Chryseobacterium gleum]
MKITVTGSLGNISRILTEKLVSNGHQVAVISSRQENTAAINALGAEALIGRLDDEKFIHNAFKNADAVYTMIPPSYGTAEEIKKVGSVYARAVTGNKVPYVVNLSGIGAHLSDGPGPAGANYHNERAFNLIGDTHVLHLRPGLFYSNFYAAADMIRYQHMIGNNFDENIRLALSHPADIAHTAFKAIHYQAFSGKDSVYVVSAEITGKEIAETLGKAANIPDLKWVEFPDEVLFENLLKQGMTAEMAKTYIIDMGIALRSGTLLEAYFNEGEGAIEGAVSFEKFAEDFAEVLK